MKRIDLLAPVTTIDSLSSRINEDERDDPGITGKFYEVLMFAKEPQATTDYYLFKFYRNDSLTVDFDTDIYYADDELLGENDRWYSLAGLLCTRRSGARGMLQHFARRLRFLQRPAKIVDQ